MGPGLQPGGGASGAGAELRRVPFRLVGGCEAATPVPPAAGQLVPGLRAGEGSI